MIEQPPLRAGELISDTGSLETAGRKMMAAKNLFKTLKKKAALPPYLEAMASNLEVMASISLHPRRVRAIAIHASALQRSSNRQGAMPLVDCTAAIKVV